jgi:hypothetical protein
VASQLAPLVEDELGLDRGTLSHISMEEKTWGDASLGCPKPGVVYAQIITRGWSVLYATPDGREISVHTDQGLQNYTICDSGSGLIPAEGNNDLLKLPVVKAASTLLAGDLNIELEDIEVIDVVPTMWRNSCLGCAESGEMCLTVMTPGYRVRLAVDDQIFTIHTNEDGSANRLCEKADGLINGID